MEIVSDIRTETNEEKPKKNDPKIVINEMTEITCKNFVGGESVNSEGTEYKISNEGNEKGNNSNGQNIKDYGVELGGVDEVDCKSQFYSEEDGEESLFFVDNKPSKHYKRHEYAASAPQFSVVSKFIFII
ncbi:hypothetical protein AAG570_000137 [Ranatra chinensis]|uniref:Uncharacterized protein n=1 Tax=Ranatra chinensis TaxID=642074 RepID=A0ABD0YW81_9HEMI